MRWGERVDFLFGCWEEGLEWIFIVWCVVVRERGRLALWCSARSLYLGLSLNVLVWTQGSWIPGEQICRLDGENEGQ